jgi:hypothetical protein
MASFNFNPITRDQTIDQSFQGINDNFDNLNDAFINVDSTVSNLGGAIQTIDENSVRIKVFQAIISTPNQTVYYTPEPYQTGRLMVYSGGLLMAPGVHYTETNDTTITFVEGREATEVVQIIEFQVGDGDNLPFPIGTITIFTSTETAAGTIDGTDGTDGNGTFTLTHDIHTGSTPAVRISGIVELVPEEDFTWVGNTITILAPNKPIVGETVVVQYQWSS